MPNINHDLAMVDPNETEQPVTPPTPAPAPAPAAPAPATSAPAPIESAAPVAPAPPAAPASPAAPAPNEDFESLVENYMEKLESVETGQIFDARIVEVHREYVLVDIGDKSEAIVNIAEFLDPKGEINISVGDVIPVLIGERDEETGIVEVSYSKARQARAWQTLEKAHKERLSVKGKIARVIKGGLEVDLGVLAFCPASQVDLRRVENLETLVGQTFDFAVAEFNQRRGRVVVSRRVWLEMERELKREGVMKALKEGEELTVTVKNIAEFGVFCDLGGVDGLIPRDELSWDRGMKPSECVHQGEEIRVLVLSVDREKNKISLSRRKLKPDPWEDIETKFPVGATVSGKVVTMASYGAFVHLTEGITGLLHAGDLTWDKGPKNPADFLKVGDHVKVAILDVNKEKRQLALGLKQITMDPWAAVAEKYLSGQRYRGTVSSVTKFGAFVRLEEGIEGLIHISDLSWDRNVRKAEDVVKAGDEVEVEVVNVDMKERRMSLSIKRLQENPISVFAFNHPVNSVVEGKVVRLTDFGAFIELAPGIDGMAHVSQISEDRIDKPSQALKEGEVVKALIQKIDPETGKISLSIKDYVKRQEKDEMKQFLSSMGSRHGGFNMGDLLRNAAIQVNKDDAIQTNKDEKPSNQE